MLPGAYVSNRIQLRACRHFEPAPLWQIAFVPAPGKSPAVATGHGGNSDRDINLEAYPNIVELKRSVIMVSVNFFRWLN